MHTGTYEKCCVASLSTQVRTQRESNRTSGTSWPAHWDEYRRVAAWLDVVKTWGSDAGL